jgi:hypothetical protein
VAVTIRRRPSLDDADALERGQPVREQAARDPRQPTPQLVEVSRSAEKLADNERCPALGEDLGASRDGTELTVSAHQ